MQNCRYFGTCLVQTRLSETFTALKIAVFAAMLNASVSTQTDEKPGRLSRIRARLQISFQN
jgi:hypothetical protein